LTLRTQSLVFCERVLLKELYFKFSKSISINRSIPRSWGVCEPPGVWVGDGGSQAYMMSRSFSMFTVSLVPWCSTRRSQLLPRK